MKIFNRSEWIEKECVFTGNCLCDACPYVVYDENGLRKCDKEMFENCCGQNDSDLKEDP